jgi:hypothetical protein
MFGGAGRTLGALMSSFDFFEVFVPESFDFGQSGKYSMRLIAFSRKDSMLLVLNATILQKVLQFQ